MGWQASSQEFVYGKRQEELWLGLARGLMDEAVISM
jgi:hypothetical protein